MIKIKADEVRMEGKILLVTKEIKVAKLNDRSDIIKIIGSAEKIVSKTMVGTE